MSEASEELAAWIAIGWLSRNTVAFTLCSSKFVPDMSMARRNSMIDLAEVFLSQKAIVCVYTMSFPCKSRPSFASSILDSGGPSAGLAFVDQRIDDDTVKLRRQQLFSLSPEVGSFFFLVASQGPLSLPLWAKLSPKLGYGEALKKGRSLV